jgi:hypothetical protein
MLPESRVVFIQYRSGATNRRKGMDLRLDQVGIFVEDMHPALGFYHRLGLETAEGAADEPHAEAVAASGLRVAWDTVELTEQIDPS